MNKNWLSGTPEIVGRASVIVRKEKDSFKILKNRNPEDKKALLLIDALLNYPNNATLMLIDN